MNFQTNKQPSIKLIDETQPSICPSLRIKTCVSDGSENEQTGKRFQRSQNKKVNNPGANISLANRDRLGSLDDGCMERERKTGNQPMIRSVVREINLYDSQIAGQKFMPHTMRQLKLKENLLTGEIEGNEKSSSMRQLDKSKVEIGKRQLKIEQGKYKNFPFRTIASENQNEMKASQIITLQPPTPSQSHKDGIKNPLKSLFDKHCKTFSYCEIANTSTQSSIPDMKKSIKKIAYGCQTENKKVTSFAVNTINLKTNSIKVQTDEGGNSFHKTLEDLRNKLVSVQQQNKRLKLSLASVTKEKEDLVRQVRENKENYQKSSRTITLHRTSHVSSKQNCETQPPSYKQISLQQSITHLKKQIETLKSGLGIKKVEQVLESVKRQNLTLISQLQAISLKCRVLEQQNNELASFEQENRKLKVEIKYFRGSVKDHQMEIERLKGENKKLRNMPKLNGNFFQDSRVFSGWGSETDSLNLSVSFIRD